MTNKKQIAALRLTIKWFEKQIKPRDCISYMSYFPEELDMFIFPAWLKHWVSPFKSDCERISVSGNVHDSAPLNNISKFAPEYIKDREKRRKG